MRCKGVSGWVQFGCVRVLLHCLMTVLNRCLGAGVCVMCTLMCVPPPLASCSLVDWGQALVLHNLLSSGL